MVAAVKGYKLVLVMPESMSIERRRLMLAYGATFDLTPREKGMKGAIERAHELSPANARCVDAPAVRKPGQHRCPRRTTAQSKSYADFRDARSMR
jgi:cysteine synthase A